MSNKKKKKWKIIHYILVIIIPGYIFIMYFNRVPERYISPANNIIVSPAHGKVIHIEEVNSSTVSFFKKGIKNSLQISEIEPPYHVVVIEMNLKNVHAQRAPIDGTVVFQQHIKGKHVNALTSSKKVYLANYNEKNLIVFKNNEMSIGVIQVAGKAARRIRSYVKTGSFLQKGDVYGRILLGSQIVVIIPVEVNLQIKTGETVIDGETILGSY